MIEIKKSLMGGKPFRMTMPGTGEQFGPWFIKMGHKYLHTDLSLRVYAYDYSGYENKKRINESVAWYNTRESARQAVRLYRAKTDPRFHIGRSVLMGQFYVALLNTAECQYIHQDGKSYWFAIGKGWFNTEREAIEAIALYRKLNKMR